MELAMRAIHRLSAIIALLATATTSVPAEARHHYYRHYYAHRARHHYYGRTVYRYRYCRYSSGGTGLIAGGVAGALIGHGLIGHGLLGTGLGAVGGAIAGRAIDRSMTAPRRCYYR